MSSVVNEMLLIKQRAEKENGNMGLFFIDDNFAINVKRTKSLLQEVIRRDAIVPWVAQISINLLRDEELLDLIQASGGRLIFIGLELIDAENLKEVHKGFNKPDEYTAHPQTSCGSRDLRNHFLYIWHGSRSTRCRETNNRRN